MKKFKFKINGNDYEVEIKNLDGSLAEIEVNGTHYEVEVEQKIAQPITPKLIRKQAVPSTDFHSSEKKTSAPASQKGGAGAIKSPLPGTILEVFVKEGDVVKIGDKLLILEAMKMENKIDADRAGKIKSLKVNRGDAVMEGDILVEIGE